LFEHYDPEPGAESGGSSSALTRRASDYGLDRVDPSARFSQDAPSEAGRALRDTLGLIVRARWTIITVFVCIVGLALPVIWTMIQPKYRATAVVKVAPQTIEILFKVEDQGMNQFYPLYVATQIATITNNSVLQAALDREDVKSTEWYQHQPRTIKTLLGSSPQNHLERLRSAIEVEQEGDTDLISIHVNTTDADDAHVLANAVLEEYIEHTKHESNELESLRFDTLRREHGKVIGEIETLVERRGELSKQLGTDNPDIVRAQLAEQLGQLEMERKRLYSNYQLMRWDLEGREEHADAIESMVAQGNATNVGSPHYSADAEWGRRNQDVLEAQQALDEASANLGEKHPRMKILRTRLVTKQRLLAQREAELGPGFQPNSAVIADSGSKDGDGRSIMFFDQAQLEMLAQRDKRALELKDQEIEKLRKEQEAKGELAKQVAQLSDTLSRKQEMEEALHNRIQALETEQKAPGRITVSSKAVPVSEAYKDKRLLLSLMTIAGALFCGLVTAQLRTSVNPKVFAADDVQATSRVPFLGQLPHSPTAGTLLNDPSLLVQECMRMVRTALLERMSGSRQRAIMITSATSSAGKTTVAIELAKSLAHLGKRTLLVEADLRRPTLAKRLGIENDNGLYAMLDGEVDEPSAITASGVADLDVILAGRRPPVLNPEILANGIFVSSLKRWKKNYDFVIVDAPPILPVADARILARQVDGAIMVSRSSHCRRSDVIQACADLSAAGGPLIGSVLVGVKPGSGYGYRYEYTYEALT
jgi:capsular exopolysaccharide synthesis family protein